MGRIGYQKWSVFRIVDFACHSTERIENTVQLNSGLDQPLFLRALCVALLRFCYAKATLGYDYISFGPYRIPAAAIPVGLP